MAVSNCNKEVATRLYRMLAMNEQSVASVKRDHASYAKLSLLTQQASLLQQQAVQVVNKSATKAEAECKLSPQLSDISTAISAEYGDGTKHLLAALSVNETTVAAIQRDHTACAKLSLLADQVELLQQQSQHVLEQAELNRRLSELSSNSVCRLVPGSVYYHYTQNGKEVLSRVANDEWTNYDQFHGKYLYDFDFAFRALVDEEESCESNETLLPSVRQTTAAPLCLTMDHVTTKGSDNCSKPSAPVSPVCSVLSRW